jgi:hypothetical protein
MALLVGPVTVLTATRLIRRTRRSSTKQGCFTDDVGPVRVEWCGAGGVGGRGCCRTAYRVRASPAPMSCPCRQQQQPPMPTTTDSTDAVTGGSYLVHAGPVQRKHSCTHPADRSCLPPPAAYAGLPAAPQRSRDHRRGRGHHRRLVRRSCSASAAQPGLPFVHQGRVAEGRAHHLCEQGAGGWHRLHDE